MCPDFLVSQAFANKFNTCHRCCSGDAAFGDDTAVAAARSLLQPLMLRRTKVGRCTLCILLTHLLLV
jgi:hypothetical protein